MYQLRGENVYGQDSGETRQMESFEDAFEMFLQGGWWKLSWQRPNGEYVRLVREGNTIAITDPASFYKEGRDNLES